MALAKLLQAFQKSRLRGDDTHVAGDRFDGDAGDGLGVSLEEGGDRIKVVVVGD